MARRLTFRSTRLRKLALWCHLWLGVTVGLYLVFASTTGAALVYEQTLDRWLNPTFYRVQPASERASWSAIRDVVMSEAEVGSALQRLKPLAGQHAPVQVLTRGPTGEVHEWLVDPYRATVLGQRGASDHLMGIVLGLHVNLLSGSTGQLINGYAGLASLTVLLSGLYLWWPRNSKMLKSRLLIECRRGLRRATFDLHNALGVYTLPILLVAVLTGAVLVFWGPTQSVVYWLTGTPTEPPRPPLQPAEGELLDLDTLVGISAQAARGTEVSRIWPASDREDAFSIERIPPEHAGEHRNEQCTYVEVHPVTGDVLSVDTPGSRSPAAQAMLWSMPLHFGNWAGHASKCVYVLAGSAPAVLLISGAYLWISRRRGRTRRRRERGSLMEASPVR